jgi:hypothetical protein
MDAEGYNGKLVCWERDFLEPFVIPLKIALEHNQPSIDSGYDKPRDQSSLVTESTWMYVEGNHLYIGRSETLGIWAVPITEIEAAVAVQRQALLARKSINRPPSNDQIPSGPGVRVNQTSIGETQ